MTWHEMKYSSKVQVPQIYTEVNVFSYILLLARRDAFPK